MVVEVVNGAGLGTCGACVDEGMTGAGLAQLLNSSDKASKLVITRWVCTFWRTIFGSMIEPSFGS
jgi:hypothetical protein